MATATATATATGKRAETTPQSPWKTVHIPSRRNNEEARKQGRKCLRERKIDTEQMVILTSVIDYAVRAQWGESELDRDREFIASIDELAEIAGRELGITQASAQEAIHHLIEVGLVKVVE